MVAKLFTNASEADMMDRDYSDSLIFALFPRNIFMNNFVIF